MRSPDSSWPDQEFVVFVGPDLKFAVFSLGFVDFVVFVGLGWPGLEAEGSRLQLARPRISFFCWPRSEICSFLFGFC